MTEAAAPPAASKRAEHRIETKEQLRALIGEPNPRTRQKVFDHLDEQARAFIAKSPFLLLATFESNGFPSVSPKGDPAGFVHVLDDRTLVIPDRKGNKLLFGLEALLETPVVGLIFLVPGTEETLRVQGRCTLTTDPELLELLRARDQAAQIAIRVEVETAYFHCAKAFRRSELWKPESWPERVRVSFGRQFAKKLGLDDQAASAIDTAVEQSYENDL